MNTHRMDSAGFLDTVTPQEFDEFEESARGLLDSEFSYDVPREGMGLAGALILIVMGLLMGALVCGVVGGVKWLFGVAE